MSEIILDCETIPDPNLPEEVIPVFDKGRLVDPVKIETAQNDFKEGLIKKLSVNPIYAKIVSLQYMVDGEYRATTGEEKRDLQIFWEDAKSATLFIGYNILGFDLPLIIMRSLINDVIPSRKIKLTKYRTDPVYDIMQVITNWGANGFMSMDLVCKRLAVPGKINHGSEVYNMYQEGKIDEIDKYCRDDVMKCKILYDKLKKYYK